MRWEFSKGFKSKAFKYWIVLIFIWVYLRYIFAYTHSCLSLCLYVRDYMKTHSLVRNIWKIKLDQLSFSSCAVMRNNKRIYPQRDELGLQRQKGKQNSCTVDSWHSLVAVSYVMWQLRRMGVLHDQMGGEHGVPSTSADSTITLWRAFCQGLQVHRGSGEFPFIGLLCQSPLLSPYFPPLIRGSIDILASK